MIVEGSWMPTCPSSPRARAPSMNPAESKARPAETRNFFMAVSFGLLTAIVRRIQRLTHKSTHDLETVPGCFGFPEPVGLLDHLVALYLDHHHGGHGVENGP